MKNKGYLGNIHNAKINGWYIGESYSAPAKLQIYYCGNFIEEIEANIYRKDLEQIHPTGKCAFEYQFKEEIIPIYIDVKYKNQILLPLSDLLRSKFKQKLIRKKHERKLFYLHIPKTGGTSLRKMISGIYDEKNIFPNKQTINHFNGHYPTFNYISSRNEIIDFIGSKEFITGHYPFSLFDMLTSNNHNIDCITVLRNPIERCISNIFHFKRLEPSFQNLSIIEIANRLPKVQVENAMTRYLCGKIYSSDVLTKSDLSIAKQNLKRIKIIGILEDLKSSIIEIENYLDIKFNKILNLNKNNIKKKEYKEEEIKFITAMNSYDIDLYKFALKLNKERASK